MKTSEHRGIERPFKHDLTQMTHCLSYHTWTVMLPST